MPYNDVSKCELYGTHVIFEAGDENIFRGLRREQEQK
jgi:hypothetical protein